MSKVSTRPRLSAQLSTFCFYIWTKSRFCHGPCATRIARAWTPPTNRYLSSPWDLGTEIDGRFWFVGSIAGFVASGACRLVVVRSCPGAIACPLSLVVDYNTAPRDHCCSPRGSWIRKRKTWCEAYLSMLQRRTQQKMHWLPRLTTYSIFVQSSLSPSIVSLLPLSLLVCRFVYRGVDWL